MGLATEMKNLTEEILSSFKERIKENEELVNDVQKTLDGFRMDHKEMAAVLNANAAALRKGIALGEKERLHTYKELMTGIHHTIASIQKEVVDIQATTFKLIQEFSSDREQMANKLNKFFAQGKASRVKNEKSRIHDFDVMMKNINADINSINEEVLTIFKTTNEILNKFEKEHLNMSAELRTELSKNLAERVQYTNKLLSGFQKRLTEISKENQKMAQSLRKDLAEGEVERISDYNAIMKGIHVAIKSIRADVNEITNSTSVMLDDLLQNRVQASAEWNKMQDAMSEIRKTGVGKKTKDVVKKVDRKEVKPEKLVAAVKEIFVKSTKEIPVQKEEPVFTSYPEDPKTLEQKVLEFINKHPHGVKISAMEGPLGETRMKLGYTAKTLLDEGKVLKIENMYYPKPK
jgi:hypothetical protein